MEDISVVDNLSGATLQLGIRKELYSSAVCTMPSEFDRMSFATIIPVFFSKMPSDIVREGVNSSTACLPVHIIP